MKMGMTSLSRYLKGVVLNAFHNSTPPLKNHLLNPSVKAYPALVTYVIHLLNYTLHNISNASYGNSHYVC